MSFKEDISKELGIGPVQLEPVSGGDINQAFRVKSSNEVFFLKYNRASFADTMFEAEKRGLELLSQVDDLSVPEPLSIYKLQDGSGLLMEWIESDSQSQNFWQQFAFSLASLHKNYNNSFGLDHDNFIGSLTQINHWSDDWLEFYHESRIAKQIKLGIDQGILDSKFIRLNTQMFRNIEKEFPNVQASLLHGDLWSGNLMVGSKGEPVLIDPAVYYGHREMDVAMMHLFGGFSKGFDIYNDLFPLERDWEDRLSFYQLYYILVHVNLFGGHYVDSAHRILKLYGR